MEDQHLDSRAVHAHMPDGGIQGFDPRHVFLDARQVMQRYGWGKTRGYQHLKDRELTPPPVMTHPDRWRLDQLITWEDRRIAAAEQLFAEPVRAQLVEMLPKSKRTPRKSA